MTFNPQDELHRRKMADIAGRYDLAASRMASYKEGGWLYTPMTALYGLRCWWLRLSLGDTDAKIIAR